MRPFVEGDALTRRSQDLPPAYAPNGAVFVVGPQWIRGSTSFHHPDAVPLVVDGPEESLDIDTPWDWQMAEFILNTSLKSAYDK